MEKVLHEICPGTRLWWGFCGQSPTTHSLPLPSLPPGGRADNQQGKGLSGRWASDGGKTVRGRQATEEGLSGGGRASGEGLWGAGKWQEKGLLVGG